MRGPLPLRRLPLRPRLVAPLVAMLAACSAPPPAPSSDAFPAEPFVTVASDSGRLNAEVRTAPSQPPARGVGTVELTLTDHDGEPADGLALEVVPWMLSMGHGSSVVPTVTPEGGGKYRIDDVDLFMPGRWELRVSIDGSAHDALRATFDVP